MFRLAASPSIRPVRDESVSERLRREKELLLGNGPAVPITGQYYDVIRATQQVRTRAPQALTNGFIRGINNKTGGVKSFAAATYNYPSGQMVIGASLAGASMCGSCGSPAMERQRQMAKLMGLGAIPDPELANQIRIALTVMTFLNGLGINLPSTFEVGNEVCDTNAALTAAADYIEKNGLDVPVSVTSISNDYALVQEAILDPVNKYQSGLAAGGRLMGAFIAISRAAAPFVGACKTKASAAPPPTQSAPPAAPPTIRRVRPRLNLPGIKVRANIPQIRVLNLPPKAPFIPGPTSSNAGNAGIIAAGVAAVGAIAFFMLRGKGKAPSAA